MNEKPPDRLPYDLNPDLVVLEVLMPRLDGLTACRRLRAQGERLPVLMLTARDMVGDRVTGLDAGADDYLVKPFELDELLARVRALLRRSALTAPGDRTDEVLVFADLRMNTLAREITRVWVRFRARLQLPRRVRDVPAPQDRGRRPAPADPHGARCRLRPPGRSMIRRLTLRARMTLLTAVAVAVAVAGCPQPALPAARSDAGQDPDGTPRGCRPWWVRGDAAQLERAVMNLLDNAVKFSPPNTVVEAGLRGGELTVRDHGPRIPAEDLPHVFERFWRSPSARGLPGSGLGLSIVALVVRECGGEVSVESAAGGGTLARMRLPGVTDQPRTAP